MHWFRCEFHERLLTLAVVQFSSVSIWRISLVRLVWDCVCVNHMYVCLQLVYAFVCRIVFEDQEHGLFNVTLFKRVVDDYKTKCRENKSVHVVCCMFVS